MGEIENFEKQKEKIIESILELEVSGRECIAERINQLQPHRPTCRSCQEFGGISYKCLDVFCRKSRVGIDNPDIQSCIYHSDYIGVL